VDGRTNPIPCSENLYMVDAAGVELLTPTENRELVDFMHAQKASSLRPMPKVYTL
jgi:hypothetical protein